MQKKILVYSRSTAFSYGTHGPPYSTLPECKSTCWINYFIYAIFPCSDFILLNFVSADSRITVVAIKNLFYFYSSPVALGQIYFVLVLISTNHNARYLYPEMDISRTGWDNYFITALFWTNNFSNNLWS